VIFYIKYASEFFHLPENEKLMEGPIQEPIKPVVALPESKAPSKKEEALPADRTPALVNQSTNELVNKPFQACDNGAVPVIAKPCQRCTSYEMTSKAVYCTQTGYKEAVRCEVSNESNKAVSFWRSCENISEIEMRNFQIFGGVSLASAVILSALVYWRHYTTARLTASRIQQRIDGS